MHAKLTLSTQLRGKHTTLKHSYVSPPLKLLTLPAQDDGILRAIQMSSSPGLLNGDHIQIHITLPENNALSLYTQAFTRVLSMNQGDKAEQHTHIIQHTGSRLCYLPHPLVLHTGSSLFQHTQIELQDNCELLYGEIIAAGRILNGERFAFERLSSTLNIQHHNQLLIHDNIQWQPAIHAPSVLGQMEHHTHQLNLYYIHTAYTASQIREHIEHLYSKLTALFPNHTHLLWGISQAHDTALCLRAISNNAQDLQHLLRETVFLLSSQQSSPINAAFLR